MNPMQRMYIALGASVPVAIFLIWWVYYKKEKNDAVGAAATKKKQPHIKPTPSQSETEDTIELSVAAEVIIEEEQQNEEIEEENNEKLDKNDDSVIMQELHESPQNNNKIETSEDTDVKATVVEEDNDINSQYSTLQSKDKGSTTNDVTSSLLPSYEVSENTNSEHVQTHSTDSSRHLEDPMTSENENMMDQTPQETSSLASVSPDDNESVELLNKAVLTSIRANMSMSDMESSQNDTPSTQVAAESPTQMDENEEQVLIEEAETVSENPVEDPVHDANVEKCIVLEEVEAKKVEVEEQGKDSSDENKTEDVERAMPPDTPLNSNSYGDAGKDSYTPSSLSSVESQNGDEANAENSAMAEENNEIEDSTSESKSYKPNESELSQSQEDDSLSNANNNNNIEDLNSKSIPGKVLQKQCNGHANGMGDGDSKKVVNGCSEDVAKKEKTFSVNASPAVSHASSILNGTLLDNPIEETQMYIEFPSDKVGLLIGKAGRNIKLLKQESGAEIMVHTVPFRDDIQVLQIVGTSSSVDSALTKIQGRFREVSLTEFDASHVLDSSNSFQSPLGSPATPPTFAYPIPEMSQLQLPEGIPVEVVVSAISDCDSVFLQQYTHPTFHALASLEQAMSVCYSSGSTPALLSPVQVGLVCVAQHQDVWYRAQVIHASDDTNEVTIKFVDYGGYSTVPTSTVKQIRADFITLPFQASECYLDNIAPLEGAEMYSVDSTKILRDLLMEGEFHAQISRYRDDGHPLIQLFKRHGNETQLINRLLVERGVARWIGNNHHQSSPGNT